MKAPKQRLVRATFEGMKVDYKNNRIFLREYDSDRRLRAYYYNHHTGEGRQGALVNTVLIYAIPHIRGVRFTSNPSFELAEDSERRLAQINRAISRYARKNDWLRNERSLAYVLGERTDCGRSHSHVISLAGNELDLRGNVLFEPNLWFARRVHFYEILNKPR